MKKLQKNGYGFAHVQMALAVIILAAVIGLVGWRVSSGSTIAVDKAVQDKCMSVINDKNYCKFAAHFKTIGDYKLTIDSKDSSGSSSVAISISKNGNKQEVITSGGTEAAKVVVFSGVTYAKTPADTSWTKFADSDKSKPDVVDLKNEIGKDDFKGDKGQKLEYKFVAKEACGNLTCFKYQAIDPLAKDAQSYLWFDTKNYLPRTLTSKDSQSDFKFTLTYEAVNITQPTPVK